MPNFAHPISVYGTIGVLILGYLIHLVGGKILARTGGRVEEGYRRRKLLTTIVAAVTVVIIALLWARLLQQKGTVIGLLGAGLAVALREPLLSIAGRIAIFTGHMYSVGDRIEISKISGDVVDVGFFYTRMMEIGNWVQGDQASGRIVQFSNSIVFGNHVYNYTQNFSYLWDEIHLMVTYASNVKEARDILIRTGESYTKEFLHTAEEELEQMQHFFLVPKFDLKPNVYVKVTDNWIEMSLRYIVDPKKRRNAATYMWERILPAVQARDDIEMASTSMNVAITDPAKMDGAGQRERAA